MNAPLRHHGRLRTEIQHACARKNRYANVETAVAMGMQQEGYHSESKLFFYKCDICQGFHLTKNPYNRSGRRNKRCNLDAF